MEPDIRNVWRQLSAEEKKQYFLDYYLVKVLIALAALVLAGYTACAVMTPDPSPLLRIGFYDTALSEETRTDLIQTIQGILHTDEEIILDDAFSSLRDDDLVRITALSQAKELDAIIADRDVFEWLSGYSCFSDVTMICDASFLKEFQDDIIECRGLAVGENGLLIEGGEGNGEWYSAGISLVHTELADAVPQMKEPVLGLIDTSLKTEQLEQILLKLKR